MRRIAAVPESSDIFYNRTIALLVADLIYVLVFFLLFTEIGYGASMFRFLSARHASASTPLAVAGDRFGKPAEQNGMYEIVADDRIACLLQLSLEETLQEGWCPAFDFGSR